MKEWSVYRSRGWIISLVSRGGIGRGEGGVEIIRMEMNDGRKGGGEEPEDEEETRWIGQDR